MVAGHNARSLRIFPSPLTFVCEEKEKPVLYDGAAESRAESISDQLPGNIGEPRLKLALLVKPVIGQADIVPIVFVNRTVEIVGAAFCNQCDLCARRAPLVSVGIAGGHAKFLQGIQGGSKRARECIAFDLIVIVHSVQRDVRLVAARSAHRSTTAVLVLVDIGSHEGYARL